MIITLNSLEDFTLANFAAISRAGASARIGETAASRIRERRAAFMRMIDSVPAPWIYNVTGGPDGTILDAQGRRALARRYIAAGAVLFKDEIPPRIARGAVLCRLANFIEGHAAVRVEVVQAVAAMLDTHLPPLPDLGHGAAGEMSLLSHLFGGLIELLALEEKEALALINGAPVAAALATDSLLSAGPLLLDTVNAVAAAIDAYPAPLEAYDPVLGALWRNPHADQALRLLAGARNAARDTRTRAGPGASFQAPASFRAAPRLLARALRTYSSLRVIAENAIRAVTDNPVVVPENGGAPRVLSNGGFFDADAPALFDEFAGVYADLTRLLEKLGTRLTENATGSLPRPAQARLRGLVSALAGYAEDAVATATRTPLPGTDGGGAPQNDLLSPVVQAWAKQVATGGVLANSVSTLRALCATARGDVDMEPRPLYEALQARMATATTLIP
jgi:histidine ammonia-lyase